MFRNNDNQLPIRTKNLGKPRKTFEGNKNTEYMDEEMDADNFRTATRPHNRQMSSTNNQSLAISTQSDGLDRFFAGIADTMRTFPKHEIAKVKLHISTLVGQIEVKLSSPVHDPIPMVYIPATKNGVAADMSKQNVYLHADVNPTIAAKTVLIITKNESNELVHDLTMDD